jgi:T5SS/PEP-CTERM-associated repeat protein
MASDTLPKGTIFYSGHGQAGNWSDPANWTGGVVPSAASGVALFTSDAALTSSFSVYQMMMLGSENISVTGTLNTMSTNLCNSFMICNGAVVTFAPTAVLNDAGGMIVGVNAFGSVTAQGVGSQHATLNSRDGKIGQHQGSHGVMTVDDAVWNVSDRMFVGLSGQGTLNVSDGGHVTVAACFGIGANLGGTGTVTLTGGSTLSVGSFAIIGGNGIDTDTPAPAGTGTGTGTLSVGVGSAFSVAQFLNVSAGSTVSLSGGSVSVAAAYPGLGLSGTLSGFGTVSVGPAGLAPTGIVDNGLIQSRGGTLVLDTSISGTGQVQVAGGSTLAINGGSIGVPSIAFTGSNGTLALAHGIADHATITGFAAGDSILMAGVDHLSFNASTDVLTLSSGSHVVDTLQFAGTYASNAFTLTTGSAGAMIGLVPHH